MTSATECTNTSSTLNVSPPTDSWPRPAAPTVATPMIIVPAVKRPRSAVRISVFTMWFSFTRLE